MEHRLNFQKNFKKKKDFQLVGKITFLMNKPDKNSIFCYYYVLLVDFFKDMTTYYYLVEVLQGKLSDPKNRDLG